VVRHSVVTMHGTTVGAFPADVAPVQSTVQTSESLTSALNVFSQSAITAHASRMNAAGVAPRLLHFRVECVEIVVAVDFAPNTREHSWTRIKGIKSSDMMFG